MDKREGFFFPLTSSVGGSDYPKAIGGSGYPKAMEWTRTLHCIQKLTRMDQIFQCKT